MPESKLIPPSGRVLEFPPNNGKNYTLKELQTAVGGYIEVVRLGPSGRCLVINEEGKLMQLPFNMRATALFHHAHPHLRHDSICGNAVFCEYDLMRGDDEDEG